jgi:hypothetical protein
MSETKDLSCDEKLQILKMRGNESIKTRLYPSYKDKDIKDIPVSQYTTAELVYMTILLELDCNKHKDRINALYDLEVQSNYKATGKKKSIKHKKSKGKKTKRKRPKRKR